MPYSRLRAWAVTERDGASMGVRDFSSQTPEQRSSFAAISSFVCSHKRGSVFVFSAVTAASVIAAGVSAQTSPDQTASQAASVQAAVSDTEQPIGDAGSAASSTSVNASVNSAGTENAPSTMQLNVNGQDIPVPENGSTQQTVPSSTSDAQTSVNVTTNGDANAASSLNVTINSSTNSSSTSSSSSQRTVVTQNGSTTFFSSQ